MSSYFPIYAGVTIPAHFLDNEQEKSMPLHDEVTLNSKQDSRKD